MLRCCSKSISILLTVALPRKASVANDTADAIYHPALLPNNTAGHTTRAFAGITTAVSAAAVATTTGVGHNSIY